MTFNKKKSMLSVSAMLIAFMSFAASGDTKTTTGKLGAVQDGKGGCKSGLGMCDLKTQIAGEELTMNWQLSDDMSTLTMTIANAMMDMVPTEVVTNMEQGRFVMQVGYTFPTDVSELIMPGGEPIVIPVGSYNVTHGTQGYTVHFGL